LGAAGLGGATYIDNFRLGGGPAGGVSGFEETLRRAAPQDSPRAASEKSAPPAQAESVQASSKFAKIDKADKLYEQCMELEIFLVKTLLSSMRNTVQKSGLINEGFAGKMYEDMLYDEYARDFAKNANFGMAEMAYLELTGQRGKIVQR
jgi:flagellar protein FlgJ